MLYSIKSAAHRYKDHELKVTFIYMVRRAWGKAGPSRRLVRIICCSGSNRRIGALRSPTYVRLSRQLIISMFISCLPPALKATLGIRPLAL